jgi:predicted acetyltransferase
MQYRPPANQGELDAYLDMVRLAFNISRDDIAFWQSIHPMTTSRARCLFDDSGKMLCGMGLIDQGALYFNSPNPIPTALITAVATPPEHRRKGYVRELFLGMFNEQRANGVALTALYPFYFPFYRSFGYELAHDAAQYTVKIEQFKRWQKAADIGRFVPIDTKSIVAKFNENTSKEANAASDEADDLEKLDAIYRQWASRNIAPIARTKRFWLRAFPHKKEYIPAYLYYSPDGRPAGYLIYHFEDKGDWIRDMVIHEIGAVDRQAREAIYGFIGNHDSQATKVVIWLPVDSGFAALLPDPREAEVKVHAGYMLRLLDVEGAFRQRTFQPEAAGEFTFTLTDEMLPVLNGAYRVQVRDGKADVEKLADADTGAGVRLDARALAQLYGGYTSPVKAAERGSLEVSREADLTGMQAVLSPYGQPTPYMADDF